MTDENEEPAERRPVTDRGQQSQTSEAYGVFVTCDCGRTGVWSETTSGRLQLRDGKLACTATCDRLRREVSAAAERPDERRPVTLYLTNHDAEVLSGELRQEAAVNRWLSHCDLADADRDWRDECAVRADVAERVTGELLRHAEEPERVTDDGIIESRTFAPSLTEDEEASLLAVLEHMANNAEWKAELVLRAYDDAMQQPRERRDFWLRLTNDEADILAGLVEVQVEALGEFTAPAQESVRQQRAFYDRLQGELRDYLGDES